MKRVALYERVSTVNRSPSNSCMVAAVVSG